MGLKILQVLFDFSGKKTNHELGKVCFGGQYQISMSLQVKKRERERKFHGN